MTALRVFLSRALDLILRRSRDERLAEELDAHLEMLTDELIAHGLSPSEARLAARRRFGAMERVTADYREQRGLPLVDALWQDARFGVRLLRRDRAFAMTAVLVLGVGIGVNNMLFTVLYAHTIRGLPIADADRVLYLTTVDNRSPDRGISVVELEGLRRTAGSFAGVAAFTSAPVVISADGRMPDRLEASYASGNAFAVLDIHPILGRGLEPQDDQDGRPAVAVLGRGTWQARYGGDPGVLGRVVMVDGSALTIVGVVPDRSGFPSMAEIWLPLARAPGLDPQKRDQRILRAFGRLDANASAHAGAAEVDAFFARLSAEHPESNRNVRGRTMPINERYMGRLSDPTWLAFMTVGFLVVTISAANVANLMLQRGVERTREIAIRTSLGATRLRVVRQLLMEGALLAAIGGLAGLGVAAAGVRVFRSAIPENALPYWFDYSMDAEVAAALIGVSVATMFIFALVPALQASRSDVSQVLKTGGRGGLVSRTSQRWTTAFLAAEFALAVVLLAQLSVTVRTARPPLPSDALIDTSSVITATITLPVEAYAETSQRAEFYRRLDQRLRSLPGVTSVSVASALPLSGGFEQHLEIAGAAASDQKGAPAVLTVAVGPRYFATLGLAMTRGQEFSGENVGAAETSVIINEQFAARFFAAHDPLGHRIAMSPTGAPPAAPRWLTIIGIAPDLRQRAGTTADAIAYLPFPAAPTPTGFVLLHSRGASEPLARSLREEVRALDGNLPVYRVRTMRQVVRDTEWPGRISAGLFLALTSIAIGLSVVGLYAVAAHGVSRRAHEIGVRMALGARPWSVVRMIVRTALRQVAIGFVVGIGCTVLWDRLFSSGQPGIRATDPTSLAIVAASLIVCACVACIIPARRAALLDPLATIRHE